MVRWIVLVACMVLIPTVSFGNTKTDCIVCHNSMAATVQYNGKTINLKVDAERFEKSVHGFLSCTDCHQRFRENPHTPPDRTVPSELEQLQQKIAGKANSDPVALAACYGCHQQVYESVLDSVHGKNIIQKNSADGAFCIDCHGSAHYITSATDETSPVYQFNIVQTCGNCHGRKELSEKYGIEANVIKSYLESFHGKKHILGHTKAPTCINCHGYHAIKAKDDPSSPVFGTNKINTCGGCHKGANEKFVAAITHQEPGPIPYYAEKGLILLTMAVIAFTVLHVLLEAYADIRDTFFRKTKEVEHADSEEYSA